MIYGNKALEILKESANSDFEQACSRATTLLIHVMKYKYQKPNQSTSWFRTLKTQFTELNILLKRKVVYNRFMEQNNLDKIYHDARKLAYDEMLKQVEVPSSDSEIDDISKILDANYLLKFCLRHAKNDEVKGWCHYYLDNLG